MGQVRLTLLAHPQAQATRGERITCEQDLGFEDRVVWAQIPAPQDVGAGKPELTTGLLQAPISSTCRIAVKIE